jgi:predicted phosphodiesterase
VSTFALIADVHGNLPALEAVAAAHCGPVTDFLIRQPWVAITGNHDRQVVFDDPAAHGPSDRYAFGQLSSEHLKWLAALPARMVVDEFHMRLCHGTPADDSEYLLETPEYGRLRLADSAEIVARLGGAGARVIACGHSHVPGSCSSPTEPPS